MSEIEFTDAQPAQVDELPEETRDAVDFVLVDSIEEVFVAAFGSNGRAHSNGRVQPATSRR
jgi:hypothetical protein